MRTWLPRRMVVVLAVVAMLALGGSVVLAAIPTGGGMIYACYSKTTGAMRVVNYPAVRCASSERLLSWTQIGPKAPPLASIGIAHLELDPDMDYRQGGRVLVAFVETGSSSDGCLATLSEMWWDAGVGRGDPSGPFCGVRTPTIDGVVRHGVGLTIFFPGDPGDDVNLVFNVYQEGAKYYKAPVPCASPSCGG